jgi:hypothetical protein
MLLAKIHEIMAEGIKVQKPTSCRARNSDSLGRRPKKKYCTSS